MKTITVEIQIPEEYEKLIELICQYKKITINQFIQRITEKELDFKDEEIKDIFQSIN